jgi:hypothetical protein
MHLGEQSPGSTQHHVVRKETEVKKNQPGCSFGSGRADVFHHNLCGSKYVKPANTSQRVEVFVRPWLKPASKTRLLRAA